VTGWGYETFFFVKIDHPKDPQSPKAQRKRERQSLVGVTKGGCKEAACGKTDSARRDQGER